eukprot:1157177-Pelagomonas_calceolata.AAC.3
MGNVMLALSTLLSLQWLYIVGMQWAASLLLVGMQWAASLLLVGMEWAASLLLVGMQWAASLLLVGWLPFSSTSSVHLPL